MITGARELKHTLFALFCFCFVHSILFFGVLWVYSVDIYSHKSSDK